MRRGRQDMEGDENPLNLAPFMNMVIILIPLLLMSVVFIKIGVINITAPELATGPKTEKKEKEEEEEPLNLTVAITEKGFRVAKKDQTIAPMGDCPEEGPTICLKDDSIDVEAKFERATELLRNGNGEEGRSTMDEAVKAYNWRVLYNKLNEIKSKNSDEKVVNVSANPDIPYAVVVRVMDTARYKLEKDSYSSTEDFVQATYREAKSGKDQKFEPMFNKPVLAIAN